MKPIKQGGGRGCGKRGASLGTRHTLEEGPLRKRMGEGIRAQKKDGMWFRELVLAPGSTSWSHSVNGGNQSSGQDSAR